MDARFQRATDSQHKRTPLVSNMYSRQKGSPLRQTPAQVPPFQITSEESAVKNEILRGQELLKQIRSKENQLAARISQNGQQYSRLPPFDASQYLLESPTQPLQELQQHTAQSRHSQTSSLGFLRELPVQENQLKNITRQRHSPLKEKIPLSNTINNHIQQQSVDLNSGQQFHSQGKFIDKLQQDNETLQKRLQLVVAELDRVMTERDRVQQKLFNISDQTQECQLEILQIQQEDQAFILGQDELQAQRLTNKSLRQNISQAEKSRIETLKQLRVAQNQRERSVADCEDLAADFEHRMAILHEIDQNKSILQDKINLIQAEIQTLQTQMIADERQNYEKQIIVDVLSEERNNLMQRLEELSQSYERIIQDLAQERQKMEDHERLQRQLLATKTMFTSLEAMVRMRKQLALNEFFLYIRFDERCHRTLKAFSIVLEKIGTFKQNLAIKLWYQTTFRPLDLLGQNEVKSSNNFTQVLKQRSFAKWRSAFLKLKQDQSNYRLGLYKLFQINRKQVKRDQNRMMTIWRDDCKLQSQQTRILYSIVARTSNRILRQGLYRWLEYCLDSRALVRQHILANKLSDQRQKLLILTSFRQVVVQRRDKRLNQLSHLLKEWKSWIARKKYIRVQAQKLATLKFAIRDRLLSSCFHQLRIQKEEEKLTLMQETWNDRVEPDIQQLTEEIRTISTIELQVKKIRAMNCLSKAARRHLHSYLEHWRHYNEIINQKLDKDLRAIILRKYRQTLQQAFTRLRTSKQIIKLSFQQDLVESEQLTQIDLQNTIISLTDQVNQEQFKLAYQQRLMLQHAINIFNTRTCRRGINQWRSNTRHLASLQSAATTLSNRIKTAMRRSCWKHYRHQILLCRKLDQDESTIEKRRRLRLWRLKKRTFDAIYQFFSDFKDQKIYWKITLTNLEVSLKRKGMRRWIEQANLKKQHLLQSSQNFETYSFDDHNAQLGQSVSGLSVQTDVNTQLFIQLRDQGQRILANTFARCYYIRIGHGFRRWSEVTKFAKHRDQIINRTLQHKIKAQFLALSACWKNWVAKTRIKETQASIVYVQMKNDETIQLINHQRQTHLEVATELNQLTDVETMKSRIKANNSQIAIQLVTRKSLNNYYQSKLRFLFQQWVSFFRRQKHFAQVITRVISKSLWQNGFDRIRSEYKSNQKQELQTTHLVSMKRMFWQKNVGRVVQLWKDRIRNQNHHEIIATNNAVEAETYRFDLKLDQMREVSKRQSINLHRESVKRQTYKAWLNVAKWERSMRVSTDKLNQFQSTEQIKKALRKWHARKQVTLVNQQKMRKFAEKRRKIYVAAVLASLRFRCRAVKQFCNKLSLLGHKLNNLILQSAFKEMTIFSDNKQACNKLQKKNSARQLILILQSLYNRTLLQNLGILKSNHQRQKIQDSKLKSVIGTAFSRYHRSSFMRWRDNTHYLATVEDVNFQGPVIEEVLDAQADFSNTLNFIKSQGYTSLEIQQATEYSTQRAKTLISRSIARIQHYTEEGNLYLKPKMFDRWRMYIKMRRLVRYLLRGMENRLAPVKSDLVVAFSRWKAKFENSNRILSGIDRIDLIVRNCSNEDNLRRKDQSGQQKELQIVQMSFERDELIDNYVRGQKLGIAAGRDNMQRAMAKSISSLSDNCQKQKRSQIEAVLQRNIELIAGLKDKIMHLEFDNTTLASDNEELRQFSLDGFEIARNASVLSSEREKLSIDLADKAKTIKRLLDEHDQLERSLRETQYKSENLIKSTLNQRESFLRQSSPQAR